MILPILSCLSYTQFPVRLHNLSLSFVTYFEVLLLFHEYWHSSGGKRLLCDSGSKLRREKRTAKTINGKEKKNTDTSYTFRRSFEWTAKSKIWPIRQWGVLPNELQNPKYGPSASGTERPFLILTDTNSIESGKARPIKGRSFECFQSSDSLEFWD